MRCAAIAVLVVTAASAAAGPVCLQPTEMKLLKTAVLAEALSHAAQSCRMGADFVQFRAQYGGDLDTSDAALKQFFAARKSGESYAVFKARIARELSAKGGDAKFCDAAAKVFAIALKGDASKPPSLGPTGYEHCADPAEVKLAPKPLASSSLPPKPAEPKSFESKPAESKPAPAMLQPAKPTAPKPLLTEHIAPEAATTPALSPRVAPAVRPQPRPAFVSRPEPLPKPESKSELAKHQPVAVPPLVLAKAPPPREVTPLREVPTPIPRATPPQEDMSRDVPPRAKSPGRRAAEQVDLSELADDNEDDAPYKQSDPVPNAYKPGAVWVNHSGSVEVPPAAHQPRPPSPNLYLGVDGKWHLIPSHHQHWGE